MEQEWPGKLLRRARREKGLDQADLARRAGTTQAYISRVERGQVAPTVPTLERLLHAMGLRMRMSVEPLSHGNVDAARLREDFRERTASERVAEAMGLSEFLTGVAAQAAEKATAGGSSD